MNANAKLWVQTLRSGRFKQGTHNLCQNDKYCCLGVACELYIEAGHLLTVDIRPDDVKSYNDYEYFLPDPVREWLGLRYSGGGYVYSSLAINNDFGLTFNQIATIIESEPDGLFK